MAAPPSVTQALAGCFLLLLLVQLVVHESTLAAHVSSGPELLSRRTFGVGRVLPLEHSIAAFLRSVEDRTRAARAGGGLDGRRPLDLLAREAVELGRRAALRGWSPDGAGGRGGLDVWDRGVYTSPPPRGPLPPIVEAFRKGHVDWHDLIPQHASLWERYGESRDDKFRFLTLVMNCVQIKSSTRLQCARMRRFRRQAFCCASRTRREQSIRPKISRIDFDLIEIESSEVWLG